LLGECEQSIEADILCLMVISVALHPKQILEPKLKPEELARIPTPPSFPFVWVREATIFSTLRKRFVSYKPVPHRIDRLLIKFWTNSSKVVAV